MLVINVIASALQIMSGDSLGPEIGVYVKHLFVTEIVRGYNHSQKQLSNYNELCFKNAKGIDVG